MRETSQRHMKGEGGLNKVGDNTKTTKSNELNLNINHKPSKYKRKPRFT